MFLNSIFFLISFNDINASCLLTSTKTGFKLLLIIDKPETQVIAGTITSGVFGKFKALSEYNASVPFAHPTANFEFVKLAKLISNFLHFDLR